jgi:hypothetical protein
MEVARIDKQLGEALLLSKVSQRGCDGFENGEYKLNQLQTKGWLKELKALFATLSSFQIVNAQLHFFSRIRTHIRTHAHTTIAKHGECCTPTCAATVAPIVSISSIAPSAVKKLSLPSYEDEEEDRIWLTLAMAASSF